MSTLQIRIATQSDATHISLLGKITFTETFGHLFRDPGDLHDYLEATFSVAKIKTSLCKSTSVFWIAFSEEKPVGYAKLKLDSKCSFINAIAVCQLQKIYVLKEFISLKIGRELQNQLLLRAKALGYEHIWLSVLNSNERAIRFYKKNGFDIIGNHDFTIGKEYFEFLVMSKELFE